MTTSAPANLATLLLEHPAAEDEVLLIGPDGELTKAEAVAEARQLAAELTAAGLLSGQCVGVRLADGVRVVTAMVAVWLAGGVLVPLNPRAADPEIEAALGATEPALVVDATGVHRGVSEPRRYDHETAFVLWTSGTTGAPKPILHTHHGYLELLDRVLGSLRHGRAAHRPAPNLIPVSLALNAGLYNALFGLRAGAILVILGRFHTTTFAEAVKRHQIRSTVLPPAALVALNDDPEVRDLSPLAYVRSITAPLSPTQARRFTEKFGAFVLNGYGQAEVGEVVGWTAADAREHPDKLGAAGRPHPGVDLKVTDEAGSVLSEGEVGELWVRPPARAEGYASGADLTERLDGDGFLRTGDLAFVDPQGFVWLAGRVGDVINRGGNKVRPEEVEEVLVKAPGVGEAAVVAAADERLGEVPVAVVVTTGGPLDAGFLEDWCRQHLVAYKVPVRFHQAHHLPRNEAGKLLRRQLAEQVGL